MNHTIAKDPVCGMDVDPAKTPHHYALNNTEYHFCGKNCLDKFKANPTNYTDPAKPKTSCCGGHSKPAPSTQSAPGSKDIIYTCPMHPQVRQPKPGNCPICGMALEPEKVSLDAAPSCQPSGQAALHPPIRAPLR